MSVAAPNSNFDAAGGSGTATVSAGSGCGWTAVSNASFIAISQGATGSGNGTVQFAVAANTGGERTGTLTIGGTTITISQRAAAVGGPVTLAAPTTKSPSGGQTVASSRPTLVVNNSASTGDVGTVTYRFEISDLNSFPNDAARTFIREGVVQGSDTTSTIIERDLGPDVLWYWRARATNGTVTSAYSNVDTFRTGSACAYTLSATTFSVPAAGGSSTVTVTTAGSCTWSATSNASFITITSGAAGTGNGTVTFTVAANTGTSRTGTLTVAGQTVTVTQAGGGNLVVGFRLLDPGRSGSTATTECQIRSSTTLPTRCTLESTSYPLGTNGIVSYAWTVSYPHPDPTGRTLTQVGSSPQFSFTESCGPAGTDSGKEFELQVTLAVTDTEGSSVTVTSNTGIQPRLTLRLFTCGI